MNDLPTNTIKTQSSCKLILSPVNSNLWIWR